MFIIVSAMRRILSGLVVATAASAFSADEAPREWVDPATGHRVVRLSQEPGSASLYFHQNAYTAEGDKMIIGTPRGLAAVDLKTRELDLVVPGAEYSAGGSSGVEIGRKSRQVYYSRRGETGSVIYATHLDTKARRQIATLPFRGTFGGVNADETFLVGAYNERAPGGRGGPRS